MNNKGTSIKLPKNIAQKMLEKIKYWKNILNSYPSSIKSVEEKEAIEQKIKTMRSMLK